MGKPWLFIFSYVLSGHVWVEIMGSNILGLFPYPGKSHFIMYEPILKKLAERGHNIDVYSFFPQKTAIPRYNDISLEGTVKPMRDNADMTTFLVNSQYSTYKVLPGLVERTCGLINTIPALETLKNTTKKYDVVILGIFATNCYMAWGHIFNLPTIGISSSVIYPWNNNGMGNPDNPAYIPMVFSEYSPKMDFWGRLKNTIELIIMKAYYNYLIKSQQDPKMKAFFGSNLPDTIDLEYNTSLLLVNSHFTVSQARPTVPNIVEVAGLHISKPKPLNKHLENIIETNATNKGFIYFSLGSIVRIDVLETKTMQSIMDTFEYLPYTVLWRGNRHKLSKELKIPKNVHFEPWMPQLDVLCHPKIKMFISHGGLMGTQEGIYCGVPMLGIPLFLDQRHNVRQLVERECALSIHFNEITKETFSNLILELIVNKKYANNMKRLSVLFKDRPMAPLDTAIYWIEYVIRHKGPKEIMSVAKELPWYQYFLIDVMLFLTVILIAILFTLYYIVRNIFIRNIKIKSKVS